MTMIVIAAIAMLAIWIGIVKFNLPSELVVVVAVIFAIAGIATIGEDVLDDVYESRIEAEINSTFEAD